MSSKRKLEEENDFEEENPGMSNEDQESDDQVEIVDEEKLFTIKVVNHATKMTATKKRKLSSNTYEEKGILPNDEPVIYKITPRNTWENMKTYRSFQVNETEFSVGDYVYINHSQESTIFEEKEALWTARVLECRARNPARKSEKNVSESVFLRVYWMYWPEELPRGRQVHHGRSEVIASNQMEIVDAMTVSEKVVVLYMAEDEIVPPTHDGLYWRQRFDVYRGKTSSLKEYCICQGHCNPDKAMVQCSNQSCHQWQHEECILNATLDHVWKRITSSVDTTPARGHGTENEDTVTVRRGGAAVSAPAKKGKNKEVESIPLWDGILEGHLEHKVDSRGIVTKELTGEVSIDDLREEEKEWKEVARCVFCESSIVETS